MTETIRMYLSGRWVEGQDHVPVRDPWRGDVVALMPQTTAAEVDRALAAAAGARAAMADWPARDRAAYLRRVADLVAVRAEPIALAMTRETGKAIRESRIEAQRSAETLRLCAEEAVRIEGQHIPMEASAIGAGKLAVQLRFPIGVVAAVTPFNAPVNLAMHKLGPAIAAGNPVVLKPSPKAPLCVAQVVECFVEAGGLPEGALNLVFGDRAGPQMIADPRVDCVSFTGSTRVGAQIAREAAMKRLALELGGVGPTIVHEDADIAAAAVACARNGVLLAGQSCVSVQNVFVHASVLAPFRDRVLEEVAKVRFGDPMDPETEVGTLVDEAAAVRVEAMVGRALAEGGRQLCGGARQGALLPATVLDDVEAGMEIARDEIFGPVLSLIAYDRLEPVFQGISASPYGLQAGIFTTRLDIAMQAWRRLRTGGVIVNGTSRWRSDQMPYGGVKMSGIGREGPRFAIREMTEERLLVIA